MHMSPNAQRPQFERDATHHASKLELRFLDRGVADMVAARSDCSRCGRSPVVGERLGVYLTDSGRERALCDLCASKFDGRLGEPVRVERIGAGERRLKVRRAA